MEITIFAKKRTTKDGKPFYGYISKLNRRDGTEQTVSVKFRDECGSPKPEKCPVNIKFDRSAANISPSNFLREDTGELETSYTLWISAWENGSPYIDKSLDDFE